jgi:hypothetical protein
MAAADTTSQPDIGNSYDCLAAEDAAALHKEALDRQDSGAAARLPPPRIVLRQEVATKVQARGPRT